MNQTAVQIILIVLTLSVGAAATYFRTNNKLQSKVSKFIADAEDAWKSSTKAGGQKFEWVVDNLYQLVPAPLRVVFTRELIGAIVQHAFDGVQSYAKLQLDKVFAPDNQKRLEEPDDEK